MKNHFPNNYIIWCIECNSYWYSYMNESILYSAVKYELAVIKGIYFSRTVKKTHVLLCALSKWDQISSSRSICLVKQWKFFSLEIREKLLFWEIHLLQSQIFFRNNKMSFKVSFDRHLHYQVWITSYIVHYHLELNHHLMV